MSAVATFLRNDNSTRLDERRYRAIFDAAAIGILQCSFDGRVLESNPAAQHLLGYSHAEFCGMHFREFIHPDDRVESEDLFNQIVDGRRANHQIEFRPLSKHNASGWVCLTVSIAPDGNGLPESFIGMVEDITERRRSERQLREAQKMEVIGRLVGGVAHDFNNLLTGIMLYCDLIRDGLDPRSRLRHHAEEIRLASEHGAALVQQLLSVARQQGVAPQVLSLNETVIGMRNLLQRLIGENVRLTATLAPDLGFTKMDPAQVQQIILNLVLNARDAMPEGGRIRVQTRNAKQNGSERAIELIVTDNGCGMSPEVRSHLFEPFFTTKGAGQGNGLGLATVHDIVLHCGGSITVDSEPNRGTKVIVRLPWSASVASPSVVCDGTASLTNSATTILIVEDNAAVRDSARRILREEGYRVLEAPSGADAVKICLRHRQAIDLLLVDLVMPGMNGRQVARKLHTLCRDLRVLYTSGYDQPQGGEDHEPVVFFRKPFSSEGLLQKVREILNQPPVPVLRRGMPL